MEITWYGQGCVRLRGKEGTIAADPFPSVVGPTGRGLTADVVTFSHLDPHPVAPRGDRKAGRDGTVLPTSLEPAFCLTSPGEYEVHDILVTGVRAARDEVKGAERGLNTAFVFQLDQLHIVHLGDLGHVLTEEQLHEIGAVDVACLPVGGHLSAGRAAAVVAQLDANLVVPLPVGATEEDCEAALAKFLHEMGAQPLTPQPKLTVTPSSLPQELTLGLLEPRNRA